MLGFGSGTLYKLILKSDGSPNWPGIAILLATLAVVFVWRCMVFIPEYWVGVRLRFNRVVRNRDDVPVEYDPLSQIGGKKTRGIRFRFYLLNSIRLVNCGDRETDLDIDSVTVGDYEFDTSIGVVWNVSRQPGCPAKSFLRPAETSWRWKNSKDELESLVKSRVSDAILRSYSQFDPILVSDRLPLVDIDDLAETSESLLEEYGVCVTKLLYGKISIASARRNLEGQLAIANSNEKIAAAHHDVAAAIRSASPAELSSSDRLRVL